MTVDPLTSNGEFSIRFDQDMKFPTLNDRVLNKIFRITFISNGGDVKYETRKFKDLAELNDTARTLEEQEADEEELD